MPTSNKVPMCPTPTIDAAMDKYRALLNWFGHTPEDIERIESGLEGFSWATLNGEPPVYAIRGLPVRIVKDYKPRRMAVLSTKEPGNE